MANQAIHKSQHLLKRLDEDTKFLSHLMARMNSLSAQVIYVSGGISQTWSLLEEMHQTSIGDRYGKKE